MNGAEQRRNSVSHGVAETFQDFWRHRPIRPRYGGKLGGVAAAFGTRYGIDPVLLRIVFVIGTFYSGAGLLLYLLGWLLLPKEGEPVPTPQGLRMTTKPFSGPAVVLLTLLLIPASYPLYSFSGLFGVALGVGGVYLLHRNYGDRVQSTLAGPPSATEETAAWPTHGAPAEATGTGPDATRPPDWDPLGAAPFAWNLPDPTPPPPEPAPARRWLTLGTLVLATVVGLGCVSVGVSWGVASAIVLGLIGVGLVVGAFLRTGRGLIGLAIPAALVATMFNSPHVPDSLEDAVRTSYTPTTDMQLRPHYRQEFGTLDLSLVNLRPPEDGKPMRSSARVDAGKILVTLPPNVDVRVRCRADEGSVDCLGKHEDGNKPSAEVTDLGPDGPGGGHLDLDLRAESGVVEVIRG